MTRRGGDARPRAVEAGLRRVTELAGDATLPDSDPRLVRRMGDEIRASGPMTFARFMELALYDPDAGYYASAPAVERGPGRQGDFLTAPESHPIFGWALARHLESAWDALDRPARFVVREHGAGSGALAGAILDGLRRSKAPLLEAIRYQAVDVGPARLAALEARLGAAGLGRHLEPWDGAPAEGAVLANELLDALPVHRVAGGPDGELLERFVTLADPSAAGPPGQTTTGGVTFATELGPPSTPALEARLAAEGVRVEPGQDAEVCLAVDDWVREAVAPLERGELLVVDYGHPAVELYRPERGSLLRAYYRHRVHADPFVAIGRQDLTAHVDLTALDRAAAAAGLTAVGRARQADFLAALGIGELLVGLQSDGTTLPTYLQARSALVRMLDPRATGAFAVVGFARGLPSGASLRGFVPA